MKYRTCWHLLHLLISIIIWPWAFVWLCCAISAHRHNRAIDRGTQEEMLEELTRLNKGVN